MRAPTLLLAAGALVACGHSNLLPDGGRTTENCSPTYDSVTVKVVDASGNPVSGATVTATGAVNGGTLTATTNGAGIAALVPTSLGSGTVAFSATTAAGKSSTSGQVNFSCGQCHCVADPATLTLTV